MLTILIIFFLATSFYAGYRRGFLLQIIYSVGYTLSFVFAKTFYKSLGTHLKLLVPYPAPTETTKLVLFDKSILFDMNQIFYAACAFVLILLIGWLLTRFVGMLCYAITFVPIIKQGNNIAGGLLNALFTLFGLTIFLTILAMFPMDFIQRLFKHSYLARLLVNSTPLMSSLLHNLWISKVI